MWRDNRKGIKKFRGKYIISLRAVTIYNSKIYIYIIFNETFITRIDKWKEKKLFVANLSCSKGDFLFY